MVTKGFFGEKGGVFQQCPEDPATVHPVRAPERECGWPEGPEYIRKAGALAGLLQLHCVFNGARASHKMLETWQVCCNCIAFSWRQSTSQAQPFTAFPSACWDALSAVCKDYT